MNLSRACEVWGSPEAIQREIESRKMAMEENERYRRGKLNDVKNYYI